MNPSQPQFITNSKFINNTASQKGGGIFLKNAIKMKFRNVTSNYNTVLRGDGGGFYYESENTTRTIHTEFDQASQLVGNSVNGSGGAGGWNHYSPKNLPGTVENNSATVYAPNFATYGSQIKINTSRRNLLQLSNLKPGGTLPTISGSILDSLGNVLASDSSSTVTLVAMASGSGTVVLNGQTTQVVNQGLFSFSGVILVSQPGNSFSIQITSTAIDSTKPDNANQPADANIYSAPITTRTCLPGELLLASGECKSCVAGKEYQLKELTVGDECKPCIHEVMICRGGSNIGPQPGYWRSHNTSEEFHKCLRKESCQGMVEPTWSPVGQCASGYQGTLCAECQPGFYMEGVFECRKCPSVGLNVFRIFSTIALAFLVVVAIVRSAIQAVEKGPRHEWVYFKILVNHFQLVIIVSAFNLRWPQKVLNFFEAQKSYGTLSAHLIPMECLPDILPKPQHFKMVMMLLSPLILITAASLFWALRRLCCFCCVKKSTLKTSRTIFTCIVLLFLIHPTLVQESLEGFNCIRVEERQFMAQRVQIECYSSDHLNWIISLSIPILLIWGLGIPIVLSIGLMRRRKQLDLVKTQRRWGFLYMGYKKRRFFWELLVMGRKVLMILSYVLMHQKGAIVQGLFVSFTLTVFMVLTMHLQPFTLFRLNQIETFSILTSLVTVYCGFFYLFHRPEVYTSPNLNLASADNGFRINPAEDVLLYLTILLCNVVFLLIWGVRLLQEVLKNFKAKNPNLYNKFCLCKSAAVQRMVEGSKVNEVHKEKLENQIDSILRAFNRDDLKLNPQLFDKLTKCLNYQSVVGEVDQSEKVEDMKSDPSAAKSDRKLIQDDSQSIDLDQTNFELDAIDVSRGELRSAMGGDNLFEEPTPIPELPLNPEVAGQEEERKLEQKADKDKMDSLLNEAAGFEIPQDSDEDEKKMDEIERSHSNLEMHVNSSQINLTSHPDQVKRSNVKTNLETKQEPENKDIVRFDNKRFKSGAKEARKKKSKKQFQYSQI